MIFSVVAADLIRVIIDGSAGAGQFTCAGCGATQGPGGKYRIIRAEPDIGPYCYTCYVIGCTKLAQNVNLLGESEPEDADITCFGCQQVGPYKRYTHKLSDDQEAVVALCAGCQSRDTQMNTATFHHYWDRVVLEHTVNER